MSLYYLNVTLHVLAAFLWLGGMLFLAAVGAPVLRKVEPPELRAELFRKLGTQFRAVGWIAIAILLATGLGNLYFRGLLRWDVLGDAAFWTTPYGHTLAAKLGTVAAMVLLSGVHDFIIGPLSTRVRPGTPEAQRLRRTAALLARVNAAIGIVLIAVAVRLTRGA